jgi:hypothetical protein
MNSIAEATPRAKASARSALRREPARTRVASRAIVRPHRLRYRTEKFPSISDLRECNHECFDDNLVFVDSPTAPAKD